MLERVLGAFTLVVGGAARAGEAHVAQVGSMLVAVGAAAGDGHGRMRVCAWHCAVGQLGAEGARGSAGELGGVGGGEGELVGKGSVWERRWWGLVVGVVGAVGGVPGRARGRKCRHGAGRGCTASRSGVGRCLLSAVVPVLAPIATPRAETTRRRGEGTSRGPPLRRARARLVACGGLLPLRPWAAAITRGGGKANRTCRRREEEEEEEKKRHTPTARYKYRQVEAGAPPAA